MSNQILIDESDKHLHTMFNSWGNMIKLKALKLRLSGLNTTRCPADNRDFSAFFVAYISRTPYDNKHNAGGVEEQARREVNNYHSLVALVQRLHKIKFSECFHSLIGECTTHGELVSIRGYGLKAIGQEHTITYGLVSSKEREI